MPVNRARRSTRPVRYGARIAFVAVVAGLLPLLPGPGTPPVLAADGVVPPACQSDRRAALKKVSVPKAGVTTGGDGVSNFTAISGDGSTVAFTSKATNIVGNDTNAKDDIFVRDMSAASPVTERVSVDSAGFQSDGHSGVPPSLSNDGKLVVFDSYGSKLSVDRNGAKAFNEASLTNSQVTVPNNADFSTTGTWEAWVYPTTFAGYNMIMTKGDLNGVATNHFELRLKITTGVLQFLQTGTAVQTVEGTARPVLNAWNHVAVTKSGTTVRLYVNGVQDVSAASTIGTVPANTELFRIGARDDAAHEFRGRLDEVALYKRVLTAAEVAEHYRAGEGYSKVVASHGPYSYWRLGEVSGTVASDSGAGNHPGTFSGTAGIGYSAAGALTQGDIPDVNGIHDRDVYLRDRTSTTAHPSPTTSRISKAHNGGNANGGAFMPYITPNGKWVVFVSYATNIVENDTNGKWDIFRYNMATGVTQRVSVPAGVTAQSNGLSTWPSVSDDGNLVSFLSEATNLVSGDTNAKADVFVKNMTSGDIERVTVTPSGGQSAGIAQEPWISGDGRYVVFAYDHTDLVTGDTTDLQEDVFVRDRTANTTTRVSVNDDETQAIGTMYGPRISGNGRFVTYHAGLIRQVYVRDLVQKTTYLVSATPEGLPGRYSSVAGQMEQAAISWDGRKIAFSSGATDLETDYNNYQDDVYLYDQGPVVGGDVKRFIAAWTPRVSDWTEENIPGGYSTAILGEGFHSMSDDQKNYLVDCLFTSLKAGWTGANAVDAQWHGELRLRLFQLVFEKSKLAEIVNNREITRENPLPVLPKPTDVVPAFVTAVLNGPRPESLPRLATEPLPIEIGPAVAEPSFENVTEVVPVPTAPAVPAESAAIVNGLTNPAVSVADAVEDELAAVTSAVDLPQTPVDLFGAVAAIPLPPTRFKACYETATTGPACSAVVPVASIVPLDVTGDGTFDVSAQLSSNLDELHPLGQSNKLEVERLATSETAGSPLTAHVYVVFELENVKQRVNIGFDGYRRGVSLSEKTTGILTLKDLADFARGDITTRFSLTHDTPPSAWALTLGTRRYGEGDDSDKEFDPITATVRFSPVPVSISGNLDLRSPSGTPAMRNTTLDANLSEPATVEFTADQLTSATGRSVILRARAVTVPTTVRMSLDQSDSGKTRLELSNGSVLPRASVLTRVAEGTQVELVQADALDVPTAVTLDLVKEGKARIEAEYDADQRMRQLSFSRSVDLGGVRDSTTVVRARSLPTSVSAHYGSGDGGAREFNQLHYVADGDIERIDIAVSDRSDGDATVAHGVDLPRRVDLDQDSGAKKLDVVANAPAGSLDVMFSKANAKVYRPAAAEHVTFVGSTGSDAPKGASLRLSGLREIRADYNDPLKVSGIVTAKASTFLAAARTPEATGFVELSNLPATFSVSVNRAGLTSHYEATGSVQRVAMNASMPGGPLVDVVLDDLPGVVDVTATLGANPGFTYTADAVITAAKVLYSTDANPSPTAGTSVFGTLTGVPRSVVASVNATTSTVDVQAPGGVGEIDMRVVSNGGPLHVPAGDHTTFFKRGDRAAASVHVGGLKTATATFGERLDAKLTVTPRGGFLVRGRVEDLYVDASVSDLPRSLDLVVTRDPIVATYTALDPVAELRFYVTDYAGGTTFRGLAKNVPSTMHAKVNLPGNVEGLLPGITYDASGVMDLVEIAYSPDHVTTRSPLASGRYLSASVTNVPRDFTVTYDTAGGVVDWLSTTGPAGAVSAATRGVLPDNLTVLASATSVPAHWKATYTKKAIAFDGFGSTIGTVAAAITNNGGVPTSPSGYHFRARAGVAGTFDISARIPNVASADYRTGDDTFHVGGGTGFGTAPLAVDVDVTQKGKDDSTTDDKRLKIVGRVTTVPSSFTITSTKDVITYVSNGQFAAQLDGELGWASALDRAPALPLVYGIAVSDGACTSDDARCTPAPDVSLCDAAKCFGLKFRVLLEGSVREAVVDLGSAGPKVKLTDVRLTGDAFSAVTKIDDLMDLPLDDFVQQGIPQGATLDFGPFTMTGGDGVPFRLRADTQHSVNLGRLDAHLSLPDMLVDGGDTRVSNVKGHLMASELGANFAVEVTQGALTSAAVISSANIREIRADVDADYSHRNEAGQWVVDQPGQSAVLRLTDVWGDVGGWGTTFQVENYDPATALPPSDGTDAHKRNDPKRCDPDGDGPQGTPTEAEVAAKTERGMTTPHVLFTAPAPGTDIVVDVDAPIVRMTGPLLSATVQGLHLGIENMSRSTVIQLSQKAQELVIKAKQGESIGRVWVQSSFGLDLPCSKIRHEGHLWGPFSQEANVQWAANVDIAEFHLSITDIVDFKLQAGTAYLAYGVEGLYGTFTMAAEGVDADLDVEALYEIESKPHWSWLGKYFYFEADIDDRYTTLYAHLQDQEVANPGYRLRGQVGAQMDCIDVVETRPSTYAMQANGATFTNGTGAWKQNVFTLMDPQSDSLLAAGIDLATGGVLSPFDKEVRIDWIGGPCLDA